MLEHIKDEGMARDIARLSASLGLRQQTLTLTRTLTLTLTLTLNLTLTLTLALTLTRSHERGGRARRARRLPRSER